MNITEGSFKNIAQLTPVSFSGIPIVPKRLFWVKDVEKGSERGYHAHKVCEQLLICVRGVIQIWLYDGNDAREVILTENDSLLITPNIWSKQKYLTGQDVLLVLCSHDYDENDYIRGWDNFFDYISNLKKV